MCLIGLLEVFLSKWLFSRHHTHRGRDAKHLAFWLKKNTTKDFFSASRPVDGNKGSLKLAEPLKERGGSF